jgi:hypothetical protein
MHYSLCLSCGVSIARVNSFGTSYFYFFTRALALGFDAEMSRSLYIPLLNGTEQVAVPLEALPDPNEFLQLLRDERCSIRTWLKCAVSRAFNIK